MNISEKILAELPTKNRAMPEDSSRVPHEGYITGFIDFCNENILPGDVYLETGTCSGTSAIIASYFAKHVITIDSDIVPETLKRLAGYSNVTAIHGDTFDIARVFRSVGSRFQVLYIDTIHEHNFLIAETIAWWPCVARVIAGHDYCEEFPGVIQAVNELFGGTHNTYLDTTWVVNISKLKRKTHDPRRMFFWSR